MNPRILYRAEVLAPIGLWVLVFILIGTPYPYHFDSVNFALAIVDHIDLRLQQPQPPGFLFHVVLGKLLAALRLGNPFIIQQVQNLCYLAMALFCWSRSTARKRGDLLFLSTMPLLLFFCAAPLSQAASLAFGALIAWIIYGMEKKTVSPLALVAVFFLGVGFRQDLIPFLGPVALAAFLWNRPSVTDWVLSLCIGAVITVLWYFPTQALSGGASPYVMTQEAQKIFSSSTSVFFGATPFMHIRSALRFLIYAFAVIGPAGLVYFVLAPRQLDRRQLLYLLLGTMPLFLYGTLIHIPLSYYYAPALSFALCWCFFCVGVPMARTGVAILLVLNIAFFFCVPRPQFEKPDKPFGERSWTANVKKQALYLGANGAQELVVRRDLIAMADAHLSRSAVFYVQPGILWDRIWNYMAAYRWHNHSTAVRDSAEVRLEIKSGQKETPVAEFGNAGIREGK